MGRPGRMRVGPDDRAVDEQHGHGFETVARQGGQQPGPDASVQPPAEPLVDRLPLAELGRQILPRHRTASTNSRSSNDGGAPRGDFSPLKAARTRHQAASLKSSRSSMTASP
jgi:hypothetical protein